MKFTGYEIRVLRMSKQIKQYTIAKKMNISTQRYSQLERNDHFPHKRANEILSILGLTEQSARQLLTLCQSFRND